MDQNGIRVEIGLLNTHIIALTRAIEEMRAGQSVLMTSIIKLEATQTSSKADISALLKVVRDGNGQPSLMQRVQTLEIGLAAQIKDFDELQIRFDYVGQSKMLTRGQIIAGVAGMVITAIIALGGILAQMMRP